MASHSPPVYDTIGRDYTANRQSEPSWATLITREIRGARRVVNVGAGTGSYEPSDCAVVAVEPSRVMVEQRPAGTAPAIRASGTALPIATRSVDAAMAILTLHHWGDWRAGLTEMRRIAPRRLILTIDFAVHARFWLLSEYLPEVADHVLRQSPSPDEIAAALPITTVHALPLAPDIRDGVLGAHWRRPEAYLDPLVRANCSGLALADPAVMAAGIGRLESDIASGRWQQRHAELDELDAYDLGYRLLVSAED